MKTRKDLCAAQHTPTPWSFYWSIDEGRYIVKSDLTPEIIADLGKGPKANAAYIVRAVNAHDELVKAANTVQGMLSAVCHCDPVTPGLSKADRTCDFCKAGAILRQAIAKAEGK